MRWRKGGCLEVAATRPSRLVNLVFSRQSGFSTASICLLIKLMVTTEPAIPNAWLLSLGLKLYPSNMRRMLKWDLPPFMQSNSWLRQNRESKIKTLLTGCVIGCVINRLYLLAWLCSPNRLRSRWPLLVLCEDCRSKAIYQGGDRRNRLDWKYILTGVSPVCRQGK